MELIERQMAAENSVERKRMNMFDKMAPSQVHNIELTQYGVTLDINIYTAHLAVTMVTRFPKTSVRSRYIT